MNTQIDSIAETEPASASLDLEALMKRCLGRMDLVERVLTQFEGAFADELEMLEAALECDDFELLGSIAHRIKGSSLTVSAIPLSACADELERKASAGERDKLEQSLEAIRDEWERVRNNIPSRAIE